MWATVSGLEIQEQSPGNGIVRQDRVTGRPQSLAGPSFAWLLHPALPRGVAALVVSQGPPALGTCALLESPLTDVQGSFLMITLKAASSADSCLCASSPWPGA